VNGSWDKTTNDSCEWGRAALLHLCVYFATFTSSDKSDAGIQVGRTARRWSGMCFAELMAKELDTGLLVINKRIENILPSCGQNVVC
jgi:hypothetical protein